MLCWFGCSWYFLKYVFPFSSCVVGKDFLLCKQQKLIWGIWFPYGQALLRDLAAAAQRVEASKRELDAVRRKEKQISELQAFLEHLDAEQAAADSMASCLHVSSQVFNCTVSGLRGFFTEESDYHLHHPYIEFQNLNSKH